jgi:hypothetical protein
MCSRLFPAKSRTAVIRWLIRIFQGVLLVGSSHHCVGRLELYSNVRVVAEFAISRSRMRFQNIWQKHAPKVAQSTTGMGGATPVKGSRAPEVQKSTLPGVSQFDISAVVIRHILCSCR